MDRASVKSILSLSLPIIGGMLSQNVLNLVDVFMVKSLGDSALAAAGLGGFAAFMAMSMVLGFSTGVQALASRRKGERRSSDIALSLNAGLLLSLIFGVLLTFCSKILLPYIYPLLSSDPRVVVLGESYLDIRLFGTAFVGMNFSFRGYWNGIGRPKLYMFTLLIMHILNIFLTYVLISGLFGFPKLGLDGAAWGTVISVIVGTCVYFLMGIKYSAVHGFLRKIPDREDIFQLVKLSMPSSLQQLFFSFGLLLFFRAVGRIGTEELAAANILTNIMLVAILPGLGFGLAATSLVGQSMGEGSSVAADRWCRDVAKLSFLIISFICIPMCIAPSFLLTPLAPDEEIVDLARLPLVILGLATPLDACGLIFMHGLMGAGATAQVMRVSLFAQWVFYLPLLYLGVEFASISLLGVQVLQCGYRLIQGLIFYCIWVRRRWAQIVI